MSEKPLYHIVSLSGGKDSTAMLLKMLEEGMPVDEAIFCDTGVEFPEMYEHIDKVERNTGVKLTRLKAGRNFEYWLTQHCYTRKKPSKYTGGTEMTGYGWARPSARWCTAILKTGVVNAYLRKLRERYEVRQYVGFAADEAARAQRKTNIKNHFCYPLIDFGMTEADCIAYCKAKGYDWGGLYEKRGRVSCWCCPLQSLGELRFLYRERPALWAQLRRWEGMAWNDFKPDYSVLDLEKRFDMEAEWQAQGRPVNGRAFFNALKERLARREED